jgi:hypothetical protein
MSRPHSDNPLDDLLDVVDQLTLRHQSQITVPLDAGGDRVITTMYDPLLDQLRASVTSSVGQGAGGGALASERNVLNTENLELYDTISKKIAEMYAEVTSAHPFKDAGKNLRQWYIQFSDQARKGKVSSGVVYKKLRDLYAIRAQIENKLNPPSILEITSPCPRCESQYGTDEHGIYRHAVIVESRIDVYRSLDHTRARCVACGAVWVHGRGMRQLRWEIDQAETTRHADTDNIEQTFDPYATIGSAGVQTRPFLGGDTE